MEKIDTDPSLFIDPVLPPSSASCIFPCVRSGSGGETDHLHLGERPDSHS